MYITEVLKDIKWRLRNIEHNKYYRYREEQFVKDLKKGMLKISVRNRTWIIQRHLMRKLSG